MCSRAARPRRLARPAASTPQPTPTARRLPVRRYGVERLCHQPRRPHRRPPARRARRDRLVPPARLALPAPPARQARPAPQVRPARQALQGGSASVGSDTIWTSKRRPCCCRVRLGRRVQAHRRLELGQALTADSSQTLGVEWAAAGGGGWSTVFYDNKLTASAASIDTGAGAITSGHSVPGDLPARPRRQRRPRDSLQTAPQ